MILSQWFQWNFSCSLPTLHISLPVIVRLSHTSSSCKEHCPPPLCTYGEVVFASHNFYNCPLTALWHTRRSLRSPVLPHSMLANILSS